MRKSLFACVIAMMLAFTPLLGLASQVYFADQGVTVDFPANVDVLTRGMDAGDPILALYGKTADEVTQELKSAGLQAMALDITGNFTVRLSLKNRNEMPLGDMTVAQLSELAGRYGGSQYELYQPGNTDFLFIYGDSGRALICLGNRGGVQMELRLAASRKVDQGMIRTLKDIARRTSLPGSQ